jgi:anaerobic selenocysteine-containing dehydrogenase
MYASTKRSMVLIGGSSMHKSANGWQASRAIGCLPALTGALGHAGGGLGPRHGALSHGMGFGNVTAEDRRPAAPPSGRDYIPSEMSTILDELEAGTIKVLLLFGTNMLSSFADSGRVAKALKKMDLVVCQDLFMNETSRECADIVLPGTAWLEETGFKFTNTHLYLMDQFIPARGEAKTVSWVMDQIAQRLGIDDFFPWANTDEALNATFDHDALGHVTASQLRAQGGRQELNISHVAHPELRFPTPSGKVEFASDRAATLGLPRLPVYEPAEEDGRRDHERAARYPLILRQGRTLTHFHAFYDHGQALPSLAKADPEPHLWINPQDASARSIIDGSKIQLQNDRGTMMARAEVTDRVPSGVVWMRDGWRGTNVLTSGGRAVPDAAAKAFPSGQASYEARIEVITIE